MIKFRKTVFVAMCVASMAAVSVPMSASAAVEIYFNAAPPPAQSEITPKPRRGYMWVPGYWNVRHDRHVWQTGHWEKQRKGYAYVEPQWTQHDNRWQLQPGHWNRNDRDGDGVPNNRDRAPDNPTRR